MIPFVRSVAGAQKVIAAMAEHGLVRGRQDLKLYLMCEIPTNALLAEDSLVLFDGLSIGFNLGQGKSSTAFEWQPPVSGRTSTSGLASALEPELDQIAPLRSLDAGRVDYRI